MSFASFHIDKVNSSLNSIGKHIERTSQPDNVDPTRTHLNRNDIVEFPEGVHSFAEAVEHRIATAGLRRKVGKNQVRCMTFIMSSDHDAMKRIEAEGRLDEWVDVSMRWAKDTFGKENVVGASLHMDEYTPHLHLVVVPITTAERKKKPRESKAKKRYRTQPKNAPRLSADSIMTRENLIHFQDTYGEAMAQFGLERGIKGSEARHVDQHEYYRKCQIEKKGLEQDVAKLSTQKKKLSRENTALESDKRKLEVDNRYLEGKHELYKETNERLKTDCETLTRTKRELIATNNTLVPEVTQLVETHDRLVSANTKLSAEVESLELRKMRSAVDTDLVQYKAEIERYCPDVPDLIVWGRYCTHIGFPDKMTQRILAQQSVGFSGKLYSPEHEQRFSTEHSEAKLERDPENEHRFILKIDGVSVFRWFRDMARKLLEKMGIKSKDQKRSPFLSR